MRLLSHTLHKTVDGLENLRCSRASLILGESILCILISESFFTTFSYVALSELPHREERTHSWSVLEFFCGQRQPKYGDQLHDHFDNYLIHGIGMYIKTREKMFDSTKSTSAS